MAILNDLCRFCRSFCRIQWTRITLIICALPFILSFIILNLTFVIIDDNEGAIITRTRACGDIGKRIFEEGGSAADAAIGIMFCEYVHLPLKMGIGGGFTATMLVNGHFNSIIATPVEPSNISAIANRRGKPLGSQTGGVPGELLGYWEMHQKYGLLPWKKLVEPSIKLCKEIDPLSGYLLSDYQKLFNYSLSMDMLQHIRDDHHNKTMSRLPVLAQTLQRIADEGADVFYHGEIGRAFIEELQAAGGFMTFDDLKNYRVSWNRELVTFSLPNGLRGYTTPLPSSGAIVALVLNIIKPYVNINLPVFWHRVVEAMKHAHGIGRGLGDVETETNPSDVNVIMNTYRSMIDPDFARSLRDKIFDHRIFNDSSYYGAKYQSIYEGGSVEMCVIAPNGDAISLISSLLWPVESFFWSSRTGIILNNQLPRPNMNSNSLPVPPGYTLEPGKRIRNSHAPVIIINARTIKPFFVVSAAGGGYIPSQIITAIIKYCFFGQDPHIAINSGFLRPQLDKNNIEYNDDVSNEILEYLRKVGNNIAIYEKDLKRCSIACIANGNNLPIPQISRKNKDNGGTVVRPQLMMRVIYLMIIIFVCLCIVLIMVFEYCQFVKNQNSVVDV